MGTMFTAVCQHLINQLVHCQHTIGNLTTLLTYSDSAAIAATCRHILLGLTKNKSAPPILVFVVYHN